MSIKYTQHLALTWKEVRKSKRAFSWGNLILAPDLRHAEKNIGANGAWAQEPIPLPEILGQTS